MQSKRQIKCPQCGRFTFYSEENPSRPFCSARCKLIDLGQWADESYKIPDKPADLESLINSGEFNLDSDAAINVDTSDRDQDDENR